MGFYVLGGFFNRFSLVVDVIVIKVLDYERFLEWGGWRFFGFSLFFSVVV